MRPEIYIIRAVKEHKAAFESLGAEFAEKVYDFNNTLFGLDLGLSPSFNPTAGWNAVTIGLIMIPILSGVSQLISTIYMMRRQKKMQEAAGASSAQNSMMKSMNVMMFIMPVFSVWIAVGYPAAIGYYWICSSLVAFVQMIILNKIYNPEYVAQLIARDKEKKKSKTKKRASMMERYQQMLAEQNGTASQTPQNRITVSGRVSDDDSDWSDAAKMSKSQQRDLERKLINEARRRQAEKYGDEYTED
jgi:YidC/Oxa1 family membrane protein insertase